MKTVLRGYLFAVLLIITPAILVAQEAPVTQLQSTAAIMTQPMNVFRRFSGDAKPIYDFYGKVLGLKQLTTYDLGGNTNVARFEVGPSQVKSVLLFPTANINTGLYRTPRVCAFWLFSSRARLRWQKNSVRMVFRFRNSVPFPDSAQQRTRTRP